MKRNLIFLSLLLLVTACSSMSEKPKIQEKLKATPVFDSASLKEKMHDILQKTENLSDTQKKELETLFAEKIEQSKHLLEQSYKLRGVLVSELFTSPVDKKFIEALKKEIERTEHLRIKNTFETIDKVYSVLGHTIEDELLVNEILSIGPVP